VLQGIAMMDFFVREVRSVVDGPMVVVRFGSCGALGRADLGQVAVAREGSIMITRNPDHFVLDPAIPPYSFSAVVHPDERLSNVVSIPVFALFFF
jgi:uridine phosphorylase